MLDLFANRCLAQGTNAWTSTDHTAYTMETAGSEGFLNLLPIYLDHVLYPTLTVRDFLAILSYSYCSLWQICELPVPIYIVLGGEGHHES